MEQSVEDQEPLGVTLGYNRSYNKRQVQRKWHPRGVTGSIQEVTFKPHLEVSGEGIPGKTKWYKGDSTHSLNIGK